jgi:hypothetical protein
MFREKLEDPAVKFEMTEGDNRQLGYDPGRGISWNFQDIQMGGDGDFLYFTESEVKELVRVVQIATVGKILFGAKINRQN